MAVDRVPVTCTEQRRRSDCVPRSTRFPVAGFHQRLAVWVGRAAGATYLDQPVVVDGNLVSGRTWHENTPLLVEFLRLLKANA